MPGNVPDYYEQEIRELERRRPALDDFLRRLKTVEERLSVIRLINDHELICSRNITFSVRDRCSGSDLTGWHVTLTKLDDGEILFDADPNMTTRMLVNRINRTLYRVDAEKAGWSTTADYGEVRCDFPVAGRDTVLRAIQDDRAIAYGFYQYLDESPVLGVLVQVDTSGSRNERKTLEILGSPDEGHFWLPWGDPPGVWVPWNVTAIGLRDLMILHVPTTSAADLRITGGPLPDRVITIDFQGALSGATIGIDIVICDPGDLSGDNPLRVIYRRTTAGVPPKNVMTVASDALGIASASANQFWQLPGRLQVFFPGNDDGTTCPQLDTLFTGREFCAAGSVFHLCRGVLELATEPAVPDVSLSIVGFSGTVPNETGAPEPLGGLGLTEGDGVARQRVCWVNPPLPGGAAGTLPPPSAFPLHGWTVSTPGTTSYVGTRDGSRTFDYTCEPVTWQCGEHLTRTVGLLDHQQDDWVKLGIAATTGGICPCTNALTPTDRGYIPRRVYATIEHTPGTNTEFAEGEHVCNLYHGTIGGRLTFAWASDCFPGGGFLNGDVHRAIRFARVWIQITPYVVGPGNVVVVPSTTTATLLCYADTYNIFTGVTTPAVCPDPMTELGALPPGNGLVRGPDLATDYVLRIYQGFGITGFVGPCDGNVDSTFEEQPYRYGINGFVTT